MKPKIFFLLLNMFALPAVALGGADDPALHSLWPMIRKETESIKKGGDKENQLSEARAIINKFSPTMVHTIPTNQLAESLGRLCSAIFIVGELGDSTDEQRLIGYAVLRIPSPAIRYGLPLMPDIPWTSSLHSPTGQSARQQSPACYSLSEILKRDPNGKHDTLLKFAGDKAAPLESRLRVLGTLIDANRSSAVEYKGLLEQESSSPQLLETIKELESGGKWYWSETL